MPSFTTTHDGQMLFSTRLGNHRIEVDTPLTMGGADRAPTSPQILVASLGSCIASFVVQYCQRVGIDCEGLEVEVGFEVGEKPTLLQDFEIEVKLPRAEPGERLEAIRRVADLCPVSLTMEAFTKAPIALSCGG